VTTEPFDPTVPVPEGITVLEASAGTGKTHAVASLVVVEVAEGRPLDELLVVTFTRKATGTLRERVWQRIKAAADALDPDAPATTDPVVTHLRRGTADEVADRRTHLQKAPSNFDAATIATTHGFCQEVLGSLGVAGDAERDLVLVEDVRDLVGDAVDDLFIRRFHAGKSVPFKREVALRIAEEVVGKPDCAIAPVDDNEEDRVRHQFATTLRRRIQEQKRRGRLITYDDLLSRLDTSISDPERGAIVEERLRRRYSMAIVDEFQDTDSVQWRILQKAFGRAPSRLILVGDPKQAIYAFRGGDVFAYLEATKEATHRRSLDVSWRSGQPLLDQLDDYFAGAQFGHPDIRHRDVQAQPDAEPSGVVGPPLTVRIARCDGGDFPLTKGGRAGKPGVRQFIADDLAAEAVRILSSGSTIDGRPVGPGDLAVLTRTHFGAGLVRAALHDAGVPAVVHSATSVLLTEAAGDWLELLRALEAPSAATKVHAAAKGPFFGWDGTRLATATEADWEEVDAALHEWAAALRTKGVAGLLACVEATNGLTARLLATIGGERRLGDLRHVAELLHAWQSSQPTSTAALAGWLAEQIAEVDPDGVDAARRRLESDAEAVAVHTIHGAKGLEFPIVLLPAAWDAPMVRDEDIPVFHDEDGRRAIGVGNGDPRELDGRPARARQARLAKAERDDEELRLLYVALTRAEHQVVVWWATAHDAERSAFARILLGRDPDTGAVERTLPRSLELDDDLVADSLTARGIAVAVAAGSTGTTWTPAADTGTPLAVRPFDRTFDRHWVRTSYSGLTQAAHDAGIHETSTLEELLDLTAPTEPVEPDEATTADEPSVSSAGAPEEGPLSTTLPLGAMPGGARVGSLVHDILEHTDFSSPDLIAELAAAAAEAGARRIVEGHVESLVAGLALALDTPLGPGWGGRSLRNITRADRLDELAFDLPLAGGDDPSSSLLTMTAVADVFAGLPSTDPLASYHERLRDPLLAAEVRGFLNGSIDLVARVGDRHIVVDYKTNLLAPSGIEPTAWHYRPEAMADAMAAAHYPLQAALYAVSLHRFLRWRLPGYSPEANLGGVGYLFLRGMSGPDVPLVDGQPCGVFGWFPGAQFVVDLSDVLDRGTS
jgi:exodeoxyribonuclease V beta subunit